MKWWYLVTLMLCMLLAWQVNAEEDDDGVDDDCDEPLMKREVGKVSAVVHKRRVTLRRLPEEGCFVPPGLQCSMKGRKKLYERLEKEAKGRSGEAGDERPDREGGAGKGKGMPDGEMPEGGEKPEGSELPEGGEKERGLMRGKEALKEKVCKRFGKRTDLKFKYIERLNINPNTTSEKAMIRDIDVKSVVNDTNIPNTQSEADSSAMIKGLRVVLSTIYPGRDAQTNATADVTMYIAKGAGTLTVGDFTGTVKEGDLKFTIDISDSANWLCSADRSQCDDFVRLVLSLGGDNGKVKGKKKKTCANNLNCGQEMETNSGATLQIANEVIVFPLSCTFMKCHS